MRRLRPDLLADLLFVLSLIGKINKSFVKQCFVESSRIQWIVVDLIFTEQRKPETKRPHKSALGDSQPNIILHIVNHLYHPSHSLNVY